MSAAGQVVKTLFVRLRFILVFVVIAVIVGKWDWIMAVAEKAIGHPKVAGPTSGEFEWYCPMHPTVVRPDGTQKCPVCFMPLTKRKRGEPVQLPPGVAARVSLTSTRVRQAGVATEEIGFRNLVREIRTVGTIEWDERKFAHISARVAGRADELFINFTGVRVKKGDPVYRLYSPDLVTTQEEYLLALKSLEEMKNSDEAAVGRARRLAEATRERLALWGITPEQIADLEKAKKAQTHLTVHSPIGGIVVKKEIHAGHFVAMGEDPYTVVDDSAVWMQADVYERDLGLLKEGQVVEITAEAFPGHAFTGRVSFVAPEVQSDTRTVKARVDVDNRDGRLKAGMSVSAVLRVPLGKTGEVFYGC
jgi:membrane fusion protein, copper/silver efflux system